MAVESSLESFVEHGCTHLRVGRLPELAELRRHAAEARAERDAAAAQIVQRRNLMCQYVRAPPRDRRHSGAQPEAVSGRGDCRQHRPGICRRRPPGEREVVPDEDSIPGARFGGVGELHRDVRVRVGAEVRQADSETHGVTLEPPDERPGRVSASKKEAATGVVE